MLVLNDLSSPIAIIALIVFIVAYIFVMAEEFIELRKSKPMILAAGIIWILAGSLAVQKGVSVQAEATLKHYILEYGELFLFLLVAMTYVNALSERNVFEVLRCWLLEKKYSYRQLFWITGVLAFFISPFADNLTTALVMCAVCYGSRW